MPISADWAIETMNTPKYPLELLLRVMTVSLEMMKLVKALPKIGYITGKYNDNDT